LTEVGRGSGEYIKKHHLFYTSTLDRFKLRPLYLAVPNGLEAAWACSRSGTEEKIENPCRELNGNFLVNLHAEVKAKLADDLVRDGTGAMLLIAPD
jgi:hypothetical protein